MVDEFSSATFVSDLGGCSVIGRAAYERNHAVGGVERLEGVFVQHETSTALHSSVRTN